METKNLSILTTLNLSSKIETQSKEEDFKTGYALIIISVAIVVGNSFVLWTVKSFSKRLVADIFISSLALLDIIHTMTSILLAIIFKWTFLQHKEFGVLCKIQAWFTVTTQTHSAFVVTLINLERLTAVSRPFFYKSYVNTRRAVKTLIILLFISICIASLPLIAWGNYVLLPKMALCIFSHDSDYAIFIVVIGYADLLVVSYCFLAIRISLKKFMERQARFAARRGAIVDLQARGVALTKTASMSFIQSQRLLKVTDMVSGLFYFSWLPLMVSITRAQITREPSHVLNLISSLQPLASPLANPLIYFFTWERYKKSYIRIWKRIMSCLAFNIAAIFNKGSDSSILSRSAASQLNQAETQGKKGAKNQTDKVLANIAAETPPFGQLNIQSINSNEVSIPTVGGKPRSFTYDSSMSSRCLASQYTETKRRYTFSAESITVEKEFTSEKNVQGEGHTRHKNENEKKNVEEVSRNVISADKSQHKNSFSTGKLNKKSRQVTKPWLSQTLSSKNHQKTMEECCKVHYGENRVDHDEVSLKEISQLEHYVPDTVAGNEIAERNNPQNNECLITQRINQYLTNVMNDRDLQLSKKRRKTSGKQQEYTRKKWNGSRTISQKSYEYSSSKYQDRRNFSRQKSRQLYSRNGYNYSRKHYWEEFEDFRNKLDDDVRNKSDKNHKETEKIEDHFQETFDRGEIRDKTKGETSDQVILRIFPKSREFSRHGNKSPEIHPRGYPNHSKKRNNIRKRLELNRVSKSKNTEASIWTYL